MLTPRLKALFSVKSIIMSMVSIEISAALVMLILLWQLPSYFLCVLFPSFFVTLAVGILYPTLTAKALSHVIDYTGIATALLGTCRFSLAAITSYCVGLLIHNSSLPLALIMLTLSLFTGFFVVCYYRHA